MLVHMTQPMPSQFLTTDTGKNLVTQAGVNLVTGYAVGFGAIDAYDMQNGSIALAWGGLQGATGYNVYVNGIFNQTVQQPDCVVSGLTVESYSASAVAPALGNSLRPQNMPPNGVITPSGTYVFSVTAIVGGVEVSASPPRTVTVSPTSIMLLTPMKRLWPFPNTGLD
jgi:hypothetical protein